MPDREGPTEVNTRRSTEDIRHNIAEEKESISRTINQIGERIKGKMNWRGYVEDSPYWALGAAAGLGYLASRVLIKRTTPVERIMRSVAEELSHSLGGLIAGAAGSGLIKVTLMSIATKTAAGWIRNATSTDAAGIGATAQPQTGRDSSIVPRADTQTGIETRN
jgi:hypothetical protein